MPPATAKCAAPFAGTVRPHAAAVLLYEEFHVTAKTTVPLWLAFVGGLLLSWAILHPRQTVLSGDASQLQALTGDGTPALLEFQSPYCLACTAMKPKVDALEAQAGDRLRIIRLNVQDSAGRQLSRVYGFTYTPTFIFFDGAGQELWRQVGGLDTQRVWDSLP